VACSRPGCWQFGQTGT